MTVPKYVWLALGSAAANGSGIVIGKTALEQMPVDIFIFMIAFIFMVISACVYLRKPLYYNAFFSDKDHWKAIAVAIGAILVGTVLADLLLWLAIDTASKGRGPLVIALVHLAPVFSLLFSWIAFGTTLTPLATIGVILATVASVMISSNA